MGGETWFEDLVREHYALILSFAASLLGDRGEAEDLAQETFIVAYRKRTEIDTTRPAAPWLCGIVRRLVMNAIRRRRPILYLDEAGLDWLAQSCSRSRGSRPEASGRLGSVLEECLSLLDEGDRHVVRLKYDEGCSIEEIGSRLEAGRAGVTKRLYRIRQRLADCVRRRLEAEHG
jgi:RNA polymerase sigma-70 factor (ECF subfamily)